MCKRWTTGAIIARGYPVSEFEQRAADLSVRHPNLVDHYRAAHQIVARPSNTEPTTDEMRAAMLHYRTLFDELLQARTAGDVKAA